MPFLCSGCTESHSKWAVALQRMPLLSRVTIQKGTKEQEQTHPQSSLEKESLSLLHLCRSPPPPSPLLRCIVPQAAGLGGPSTGGCGAWCWPCLHILCCPFKSRISSSEQKHCGCLELLPLFQLDIKISEASSLSIQVYLTTGLECGPKG